VKTRYLLTVLVCLFATSCDADDAAHTHSDVVEHTHAGDASGAGGDDGMDVAGVASSAHPGVCALSDDNWVQADMAPALNQIHCWDTVSILTCIHESPTPNYTWLTDWTCEELCNEVKNEGSWMCVINGYMTCSPEQEDVAANNTWLWQCNTCIDDSHSLGECVEP